MKIGVIDNTVRQWEIKPVETIISAVAALGSYGKKMGMTRLEWQAEKLGEAGIRLGQVEIRGDLLRMERVASDKGKCQMMTVHRCPCSGFQFDYLKI